MVRENDAVVACSPEPDAVAACSPATGAVAAGAPEAGSVGAAIQLARCAAQPAPRLADFSRAFSSDQGGCGNYLSYILYNIIYLKYPCKLHKFSDGFPARPENSPGFPVENKVELQYEVQLQCRASG